MEQKFTKKPLLASGPRKFIAEPLPAFGNTSSAKEKGQWAERIVAAALLRGGLTILKRNQKFFGVEVDILCTRKSPEIFSKKASGQWIVEVKALSSKSHWAMRLGEKQKLRLLMVARKLLDQGRPTGVFLALVDSRGAVCWVPVQEAGWLR